MKTPLPCVRRRYSSFGHGFYFSFQFYLVMFHEPKTWCPTVVKKCMLHILYTFSLYSFLYLTIGSKLILTVIELWVPNTYHAQS